MRIGKQQAAGLGWCKSSYSGGSGTTSCVEVAVVSEVVAVRDSKNVPGPLLAFPSESWRTFLTLRAAGEGSSCR